MRRRCAPRVWRACPAARAASLAPSAPAVHAHRLPNGRRSGSPRGHSTLRSLSCTQTCRDEAQRIIKEPNSRPRPRSHPDDAAAPSAALAGPAGSRRPLHMQLRWPRKHAGLPVGCARAAMMVKHGKQAGGHEEDTDDAGNLNGRFTGIGKERRAKRQAEAKGA